LLKYTDNSALGETVPEIHQSIACREKIWFAEKKKSFTALAMLKILFRPGIDRNNIHIQLILF